MNNQRYSEAGLSSFGLELPPPVFRAATYSRTVAAAYAGVQTFSNEELIRKVEAEHGAFGAGVKTDRLGFWRAVVSNSSLDSYFTRMAKSSLRNYAADAGSPSVSFQNSHRHFELPVGRSVVGQFIETGDAPDGARAEDFFPAVIVDFYSHRDLKLGEVPVEQFLLGVESHVIKDVSIGFKEGEGFRYTCSICRANYWSYDCRHIAGVEYQVAPTDENGDPTEGEKVTRLAFIWIENARLSEVSAVYDGATTNAVMLTKANREARAGRLDGDTERFLERRFAFRADKKTWTTGFDADPSDRKPAGSEKEGEKERGEKPENQKEKSEEDNNFMNEQEIRAAADKANADRFRAFVRQLGFEVADDASVESMFETVRGDYNAKKADAARYVEVRNAEIEVAVSEKVRAEGEGFDEEKQKGVRSMLENCGVAAIKEFAGEWRAAGDKRFGKGRKSSDAPEGGDEDDPSERSEADKKDGLPEVLNRVDPSIFAGAV